MSRLWEVTVATMATNEPEPKAALLASTAQLANRGITPDAVKASRDYDSSPDTDDEDAEDIGLLHQRAGFHRGRRRLIDTDSEDE